MAHLTLLAQFRTFPSRPRPGALALLAVGLATLHAAPTPCAADPSVSAPKASPDFIPAGMSIDVVVTSDILVSPGEPAVVNAGVYLQRVTEDGTFISQLGLMRDDGA